MFRSLRAFALLIALPAAAAAQQRPAAPSPLRVEVVNQTAREAAARGAARADTTVRAGDVLHYRLTFTNLTDRPVRNVLLSNPLPAGLGLVAGTISATRNDARPEFSADGGRTWSPVPMETVVIEGREVRRPIPAERLTGVRWTVAGDVAPRATVTAEFHARLAAAPRDTAGAAAARPSR